MSKSEVYLVSSGDRKIGALRCLDHIGLPDYYGKQVYIKPNFNSADPPPGSTHNDTLETLLAAVRASNPKKIIIGERSGPAQVADVFVQKGIAALCEKYEAEFLNHEELPTEEWVKIEREDLHWPGGFKVPKALVESDAVICTCCLKTHGFGGVFSNALKLAVGLVPKDFQTLHSSQHMRKMIAEINLAYKPDFILSDAVEVFTDGGPMEGERCHADITLVSRDRVAIDVVGLALLKSLGSNKAIMETPVFGQEQIMRAVELGLGVSSPDDIELVADDEAGNRAAARIRDFLH